MLGKSTLPIWIPAPITPSENPAGMDTAPVVALTCGMMDWPVKPAIPTPVAFEPSPVRLPTSFRPRHSTPTLKFLLTDTSMIRASM